MANETRIADIVTPEIFAPYIAERSLNQNRFAQAGIMVANGQLAALLGGGGKTFNLPYWKDLTGDSDIPSETVDTTVNPIATDKMIARKQVREKAWGSNDLAAAMAGADPYEAIASRVSGFWAKAKESLLIYSLRGVFADNAQGDSSDLIVDISTETGLSATSANKISAKKTIEAVMKQGDVFDEIIAMSVHSVVYQTLVENDLIDYVADSQGRLTIPTYMGLRLIVSDNLPVIDGSTNGYKYHSYLFKAGAVAYGENNSFLTPAEVYRNPKRGGGVDELYTRTKFAIHPLGFSWNMSADTGITPTDANLYADTSWDRVYEKKNTGVVCLISNG